MYKVALYELKKLLRDSRWMMIFAIQPVILVVFLGLVALHEPENILVGIYNRNDNEYSNQLIESIKDDGRLNISEFDSEQHLRDEINSDRLKLAAIIDVEKDGYIDGQIEIIDNSTVPEVSAKGAEAILDAFDDNSADFVKENIQTNIDNYIKNQEIAFYNDSEKSLESLGTTITSLGLPEAVASQLQQAVGEVKPNLELAPTDNLDIPRLNLVKTINTNKDIRYFDFYASAVIVLLTILIALKLADTAITEERTVGTFERFFVTPYRKYHMILGKMIAYTILDLVLATIILLSMILLFDVSFGPYWLVFLIAFISATVAASLGILISCLTYTIAESIQASNLLFFSFLILTGFLFQPESMHPAIKVISKLLPFTYLIDAMREINLLNMGFGDVWQKLLFASCSIPIFLFGASLLLRRKAT
ncbi:MAG: ABC transporter permease [Patescibacteria group bacterium]